MNQKQSIAMKSFWAMNDWARNAHSKNMQYGWKTVKRDLENPPVFFNYPLGLVKDVIAFAKDRGVTLTVEDFVTHFEPITQRAMYKPQFFDVYSDFVDESNNADILASLYQYSLVKSIQGMVKNATPQNISSRRKILEFLTKKYQSHIYELDPKTGKVIRFKDMNIDQSRNTFMNVQLDLRKLDPDLEREFVENLTTDYPIVKAEGLKHRE